MARRSQRVMTVIVPPENVTRILDDAHLAGAPT
jgi:hypothetical protein